jgi:hypothetical protein
MSGQSKVEDSTVAATAKVTAHQQPKSKRPT